MEKIESGRGCTGIWIPLEIWDDKNLSRIERDALAEIMHFNKRGGQCYASNAYLGQILGVTNGRVSQIIKKLKDDSYITVSYSYKNNYTREVDKRYLKINYSKIYVEGKEEYDKQLEDFLSTRTSAKAI